MNQAEINYLLTLPTNSTYDELTVIGSSCQHIHVPRHTNDEYMWTTHIISIFSISSTLFAIFLILTQTSVSMGRFRWCLLNLQIWTGMTDIMLLIFVVPRFYFPLIGGRPFGVFHSLGMTVPVQVFIGFGTCGGMVASIAVLFVYRHQVIVGESNCLHMKKVNLFILLTANYLLYTTMTWPALISVPDDQLKVKIDILKTERCPPKDLLHPDTFILLSNIDLWPYVVFLGLVVGAECGLLSLHCSWILFFSTLRANFSRRTRMLQIKFLGALLLQIAIPTALCYFPILYFFITCLVDHYWQFANDLCVFIFATHGTVSTFCLIIVYDCYRDYVFHYIGKCLCFCCSSRSRVRASENISAVRSDNSRNALHNSIT